MPSTNLFTLFVMIGATIACMEENTIKHTEFGKVRGTYAESRNGRHYHSYRGIPYAKPPTGNLRFKEPQPPHEWSGVRNAQHDAPPCLQKNYLFGKNAVEGSEDCLYINVHTPYFCNDREEFLPVMVFIHWGGFFSGYGSSQYLGPDYLMDKDVVLMTFNYRLGVLGFLSTDDDTAPGNYGFKDQTAALRWVQNNIASFGGDRNRVTLFGQSAGGASVHFHMLSPLSRGLFHNAISESGTALALWAKPLGPEHRQIARLQATFVGCENCEDSNSLVDCLRRVDAEDLVASGDKFKYFDIDPLVVYLPSIEKKTENNQLPFITKQPVEYIIADEFAKIPWILGMVENEGIIRAAAMVSQNGTRTKLNENFNELMPQLMALMLSTPKEQIQTLWEKIRAYYFQEQNSFDLSTNESIDGLINLYTDRSFAYTMFQTVLLHSQKGHNPLWLYNFRYQGEFSYRSCFATESEKINFKWGVGHSDELLYLFNSPAIFPALSHQNDVSVSEALVSLWTNFAIHNTPVPTKLNFIQQWVPAHDQKLTPKFCKDLSYLDISGSYENGSIRFKMEHNFYRDRFKFWENLPLVENIKELNQRHTEL